MKKSIKFIALFVVVALTLLVGVACKGDPNENAPKSDLILDVGDVVNIKPDEGFYAEYSYSSSNEDVATVSENGILRALSEGSAIITAKRGEIIVFEYTLSVVDSGYVAPTKGDESSYLVVFDTYESTMFVGGTLEIGTEVYKDGYKVDENVVFSVDDSTIVRIDDVDSGVKLTALKTGETIVKGKIGGFIAQCTIKVYGVNSRPIEKPVITNLSTDELAWSAVEHASSYKVSLNGGATWTETTQTSIEITQAVNPLQIRVMAKGESYNYQDSLNATISLDMFAIMDGRGVKLCVDKTVSGSDNDKLREADLTLNVITKEGEYEVSNEFVTWSISDSTIASLDGNKITPVKVGKAEVSANLLGGIIRSEVSVGTPISTKEDMDALGFSVRDDNNARWLSSARYILTNDIDYSSGGLAEWHERYLVPIAPQLVNDGASDKPLVETASWGIFGPNINVIGKVDSKGVQNNGIFYGSFDGNGYAIKNAVIPMGISGQTYNYRFVGSQNFIGCLAYGAELKNIAFIGLEYENPALITSDNPYYKTTNPNFIGTAFEGTGYDYTKYGTYSYWNGFSLRAGLVGQVANATIENVYVETKIRSVTWARASVAGGMLVSQISADAINHPDIPDSQEIRTTIKGCVVKTVYDTDSTTNAWYSCVGKEDTDVGLVRPVGSLVGYSSTGLTSTVSNCYVISSGTNAVSEEHLFAYNDESLAGENLGLYETKDELFSAQAQLMNKYYIWNRLNG